MPSHLSPFIIWLSKTILCKCCLFVSNENNTIELWLNRISDVSFVIYFKRSNISSKWIIIKRK